MENQSIDARIEQNRKELFEAIKNTLNTTDISSETKVLKIEKLVSRSQYQVRKIATGRC